MEFSNYYQNMMIITIFVKSNTFSSLTKSLVIYYAELCQISRINEVYMLLEYIAIAVMIAVATLIAFIAIGLGGLFGPKKQSDAKDMPYESGMTPYGEGTRRMPVRFYLVAVLFILFDIEVVFFLPWAIAFRQLGLFGLIEMAVFIVVLIIGYIYAWKKGALEWE
ncbi:MAG: NADH-quinone oxidoreductase subunit A [Anaerolineales bacterium]|jgi:NADH-quinone oxidoreductase subunit A|nr:NADH-quinone oxidoreductase subunit A [Anaerolineales bacterium]